MKTLTKLIDRLLGRSYRVIGSDRLGELEALQDNDVLLSRIEEFKSAYPDKAHLVDNLETASF